MLIKCVDGYLEVHKNGEIIAKDNEPSIIYTHDYFYITVTRLDGLYPILGIEVTKEKCINIAICCCQKVTIRDKNIIAQNRYVKLELPITKELLDLVKTKKFSCEI
jgi:hypothetical protein